MKFEISTKPLTDIKAQSLIVGLFEDGQLKETEVALDMATKGLLSELAADKTFFSKENDVIRFHRHGVLAPDYAVISTQEVLLARIYKRAEQGYSFAFWLKNLQTYGSYF